MYQGNIGIIIDRQNETKVANPYIKVRGVDGNIYFLNLNDPSQMIPEREVTQDSRRDEKDKRYLVVQEIYAENFFKQYKSDWSKIRVEDIILAEIFSKLDNHISNLRESYNKAMEEYNKKKAHLDKFSEIRQAIEGRTAAPNIRYIEGYHESDPSRKKYNWVDIMNLPIAPGSIICVDTAQGIKDDVIVTSVLDGETISDGMRFVLGVDF